MIARSPAKSKYLKIEKAIHQRIATGQWRPGEAIPSVRELSLEYGTSMLTTRRAVESLMSRGMLVASQGVGTFVSNRPTFHRVGIVLGVGPTGNDRDILGPRRFLRLTESGLHAWAERHMLNVCTYEYRGDEQILAQNSALQRDVERGDVDGLILVGVPSQKLAWELLRRHVPAVAVGNVPAALPYRVTNNVRAFMESAVGAVVRSGLKRPMLITGAIIAEGCHPLVISPSDHFAAACLAHGLEIHRGQVVQVDALNEESGAKATREICNRADRPDALIVSDDVLARGVARALSQMNMKVPQDMAWITHTNYGSDPIESAVELARLEYDPAIVIERAADMLAALMSGRPPEQCIDLVEPQLIQGESL
jgi:DNA-binding LacI/PurR family transcriptional regulator